MSEKNEGLSITPDWFVKPQTLVDFHRMEVVIVAVYLTEMARIVFEAFLHEWANVLTVAFIPLALLIAVLMGLLLHREAR